MVRVAHCQLSQKETDGTVPGHFILAVIPARLQSTRLPNKPLLKIGDKTMLQRVWERARLARLVHQVVIATDAPEIFETAKAFGAQVVMTSAAHPSGTDRVSQAAEQSPASLIVNVQGDEPFIEPDSIDLAIAPLLSETDAVMSTLMTRFRNPADAEGGHVEDPSVVKVVTSQDGHALYFSRLPIPFVRDPVEASSQVWYKHLGLYVYQREFLLRFPRLPRGPLEIAEKLEQLRVLENGYKIRVVETDHDSIGVDTEEDLARARAIAESEPPVHSSSPAESPHTENQHTEERINV
jgi:3-deoxy-manno-octulosonate cytidylyltransferase (CMP-KDO synthetase)